MTAIDAPQLNLWLWPIYCNGYLAVLGRNNPFSCEAALSITYEECVRQHLSRSNKDEIRKTFDQILNLVKENEKTSISPQVKALYIQMILSAVNENDNYWRYNPNNFQEKMNATRKLLLDVPKILGDIRKSNHSDYITTSKFLHYVAENLNIWCPFTKPPLPGADQGTLEGDTSNVTHLRR